MSRRCTAAGVLQGTSLLCHGDRILHSVVPQALEKCCEIVLGFDIGWIELGT